MSAPRPAKSPARSAAAVCAAVAGCALLFDACLDPTQVTVVLEGDEATCASMRDIAIVVSDDPHDAERSMKTRSFVTITSKRCDANGHIGTLVVTPPDTIGNAAIAVVVGIGDTRAESCNEDNGYLGCIVARRNVPFVEHRPLTLPIRLTFDCLNVPCDALSTCSRSECVVSTPTCTGGSCEEDSTTRVDAATTNEASAPDGGACSRHDQPRLCPPYGGGAACPTTCCAVAGSGGYGYGYSGGNPGSTGFECNAACAYYRVECAGSENCPEGHSCCLTPMQTVCRRGGCGADPQACIDTCECPPGRTCLPNGPFPTIVKTCR